MEERRRLYRSRTDRKIAGVCGGIAEYFNVDPTVVRLIAVLLLIMGNITTVLAYIVMAIVIPEAPVGAETPDSGVKGGSAGDEPEPQGAVYAPPPPPVPPAPPTTGTVPPDGSRRQRRRPPGLVAGLVLIFIGVALLAAQFVPGVGLWNMWPLIIVVVGLFQAFTPDETGHWSVARFFDGLVTVSFGLLFLAITLGYVGWSVFARLLVLWPVLLISIGLSILAKGINATWPKVLGSLLVIGAILLAFAQTYTGAAPLAFPMFTQTTAGSSIDVTEPTNGARYGTLKLDAGAAAVEMGPSSSLVEVSGSSPWGKPTVTVQRTGSQADVHVTTGEQQGGSFVWPGGQGANLDISLGRSVVWDAEMNVGAASLDADLSEVPVRTLALKPGVADCTVKLGPVPAAVRQAETSVKAGVSSVRIQVPQDAGVRVESDSGLTGTSLPDSYSHPDSGVWESANYQQDLAANRGVWRITVKSGVGSFAVDTY